MTAAEPMPVSVSLAMPIEWAAFESALDCALKMRRAAELSDRTRAELALAVASDSYLAHEHLADAAWRRFRGAA